MLVYENSLADIWENLKPSLSCRIYSACMLLDEPELHFRQSSLHMGKHFKTMCSSLRTQLGVCIKTRNLTLSIPDTKRNALVTILLTTWNSSRKRSTIHEVASLLGLASNLALTTQWAKHTCVVLQHDVPIALKFNSNFLFASGKHKHLTDLLRSKQINIKKFAYQNPTRQCVTQKN